MRSRLRDLSIQVIRWGRTMSLKRKAARFSLALLFGLPVSSALAQVQTLPDTVVSATGIPTDASEIASSVTVITEEQMQL